MIAILQYLFHLVNFTHWEVSLTGSNADRGSRLWTMQGCQKSSPQGPQSSHFPSHQAGGKKLHPPKDVGSLGKAMPQGVDPGPPGRKSRHLEKDNSCLPLMKGHPFY